jgi:hypothetical protein
VTATGLVVGDELSPPPQAETTQRATAATLARAVRVLGCDEGNRHRVSDLVQRAALMNWSVGDPIPLEEGAWLGVGLAFSLDLLTGDRVAHLS